MHTPWIGPRRIAIIPVVVNDPQFNAPPADWVDQIRQRIFYDPDPNSGVDRSLRAYIHTISYGKALLEADILNPITVPWSHCGATQDAAINATPGVESYQYACVIFTGGTHTCGGWAFYDNPPFPFDPPRPGTNNLRNWCYISMDRSLGVWSMEIMHTMTGFGDLYGTHPHPGNFDNMACNCGTHPSTFTKLKLGWLDPNWVRTVAGLGPATFTLHALALLQPPPPGRVTAVRIPSAISQRYFLVEARLQVDPYERATQGISSGISSEGLVVYEIDEAEWPPVKLRTATALSTAQNRDRKYTNQAERLEIEVTSLVPGGATVAIRSTTGPVASGDDMQPGEVLNPGQSITSANGRYIFVYQGDGNLVLYDGGTPLWASNTNGMSVGVCVMQGDGNLVIYAPGGQPIWASNTDGNPGSRLVVQDDGNVVIYRSDGTPAWATNTWLPGGPTAQGDDMQPGEVLNPGQSITSANGRYIFVYQGDGNLVLYDGGTPLWASNTNGMSVGVCVMQGDGNLVIYTPGGQPIWASNTDGNPGSRLVVQDDGNVVIYRSDGTPAWATNTVQP